MPDQFHVLESLPGYALGSLDEAEARRVATHLVGCHFCRTELSAFEAVAAQLLPTPDTLPPPSLKGRLMNRVQRLQPMRVSQPRAARWPWLQRLTPIWGMISLLMILALVVTSLLLWQRINRIEIFASPDGMRAIALHNTSAVPQASGFVIISADGLNGVLVVDALPQLTPEQQYQVWLTREGQSVSGATFSVDPSGYRGVRIVTPDSLLTYSAIRITIEPVAGSLSPTGAQVLDGSLHP